MSSIHPELEESDLKSVFEAFGTIISCHMDKDSVTRRHRGYAFIEYEKLQSSMDAIASMNMFDLGGQYLRVGKAITPPNTHYEMYGPQSGTSTSTLPAAAAVAAAAVTSKIMAQEAAKPLIMAQAAQAAQQAARQASAAIMRGLPQTALIPPPTLVMPNSLPSAVMASNQVGVVTGIYLHSHYYNLY